LTAIGTEIRGRWFLPARQDLDSTDATHATVANAPTTVESVRLRDIDQTLAMGVLPSADTPAWTYVNEGEVEGSVFSIVSSAVLKHDQLAGTAVGGRYRRTLTWLCPRQWVLEAWFMIDAVTATGGYPWKLIVRDGEREICLFWSGAAVKIGQANETIVASGTAALSTGVWYRMKLERNGAEVRASINGLDLFGALLASAFSADANKDASVGYVNNGNNQNWTVYWDNVHFLTADDQDYWNLTRRDGVLANPATLTSASNPFVAGDNNKLVRIESANNDNDGIWKATYVGIGELTLDGIVRTDEARVEGTAGVGDGALVTVVGPRFRRRDIGKDLTISGATVPANNGTWEVLDVLSPTVARVNNAVGFTAEVGVDWKFTPNFGAETSVHFQVVAASSKAGAILTLRDSLPAATSPITACYTTVLSGELLLDETVENTGVAPTLFYPAYLCDADMATRELVDEILAAGVHARYARVD
jgi:hypothetical protein